MAARHVLIVQLYKCLFIYTDWSVFVCRLNSRCVVDENVNVNVMCGVCSVECCVYGGLDAIIFFLLFVCKNG